MDEKHSCCCGALPRTWRWLLSLLGLPLIFLLMLGSKQGDIENDLADRSNAELKAAGMDWVRLEAVGRGRDMLLRGEAESVEAHNQAIQLVQHVYGVRDVQSLIHVSASGDAGTSLAVMPAGNGKQEAAADSGQPFSTTTEKADPDNGNADSDKSMPDSDQTGQVAVVPETDGIAQESTQAMQNCQQQLNEAMRGKTILFATDQADIKQDNAALLESLVGIISGCQAAIAGVQIEIGGHTDSMGNDIYNQHLSQQRADKVMEYFIRQGVDGVLLRSIGYGETRPVMSNDTAEGRARNRRITFEVSPE